MLSSKDEKKQTGNGFNLNSLIGGAININGGGEDLTAFAKTMNSILESSPGAHGLKVIVLDKSTTNLKVGVLALTQVFNDEAVSFCFLVESSVSKLGVRHVRDERGVEVAVPTTVGDIYSAGDQLLFKNVARHIKSQTGAKVVYDAGACVLPLELATDDELRVRVFVNQAANAIGSVQDEAAARFNCEDLKGYDFVASVDMHPEVAEDAGGLPVRQELEMSICIQNKIRHEKSDESLVTDDRVPLMSLGMYVDLRYTGPEVGPHGQPSSRIYTPKIVVSSTKPANSVMTDEMQLFGLAQVPLVLQGNAWFGGYAPHSGRAREIQSLAGIGHEINAQVEATTEREIYDVINTFVHTDRVDVDLHISQCNEATWLNKTIFDAAADVKSEARIHFQQIADNLTNGLFSEKFPVTRPIGHVNDDMVVMGHYPDENGKLRDLRDYGYLAALNLLGKTDKVDAFSYVDTFNPEMAPLLDRIAKRVGFLNKLNSRAMRITGYAVPVTLSGEMLYTLLTCCSEAGVTLSPEGQMQQYRTNNRQNLSGNGYSINPQSIDWNSLNQRNHAGKQHYYTPNIAGDTTRRY